MNEKTLGIMFSKKSDNWETPQDFFDGLNKHYKFTLDPCANRSNKKTKKYFTIKDNGLEQSWQGETVFVNPPYSDIGNWVSKCYFEYGLGGAKVVMLIPARTDTRYFQRYCLKATGLGFVEGRLKFGYRGIVETSAPFPSVVVEFDPAKKPFPVIFKIDRCGNIENYISDV